MSLSPEERKKIYEEEKAKIEAEKPKETAESDIQGLKPNVAGLLCYVGVWITGIIFLILEKKNQFVRFHAMQSIVTFGALTVIQIIFSFIPFVGWILNVIIGILMFVLWVVLMYRAYQGQMYKLPLAGNIAESLLKSTSTQK
jgi:uncharacterized membrane protein